MGREKFIRSVCFWLAVAVVFVAARRLVLPCLLPFLWGWLAAALVRPWAGWLTRRTPLGRKSASVLALLLFWTGAGALLWWLAATAFTQGAALLERLPAWYENSFLPALQRAGQEALGFLGRMGPGAASGVRAAADRMAPILQEGISTLSARVLSGAGTLAGQLPGFALACSFTVLSSFFILLDYESIGAFLLRQLPRRLAEPVRDSRVFLAETVRQVLRAYLLIMFITFGEISLGLWFLRVDYYLIIGLAVAVLDILPVLGSGSVLIPWGLWTLLQGNLTLGIGILLLYAVVTAVRTVIEPKIVGRRIGLSPLMTLGAMYVGMKLGGFGGLILAPMAVTLFLFLEESGHIHVLK
jgi:sporulation integral membrane protein YtvI